MKAFGTFEIEFQFDTPDSMNRTTLFLNEEEVWPASSTGSVPVQGDNISLRIPSGILEGEVLSGWKHRPAVDARVLGICEAPAPRVCCPFGNEV